MMTLITRFLWLGVRGYQLLLGPLLPRTCRYQPSCSRYALAALERHGAGRGGTLALRRIVSCHPWSAGGYDPVPESPAPESPVPERECPREPGQVA
jgi:hypothetical protein